MICNPLRCRVCGRQFGWTSATTTSQRSYNFCSDWCSKQPIPDPMDVRNDEWRILRALGQSPLVIARLYHVDHSQVYRVLAKVA